MKSRPNLPAVTGENDTSKPASATNEIHTPGRRKSPSRVIDRNAEINQWVARLEERGRVKRTITALLGTIDLSQLQAFKDAKAYKGYKVLLDTGEVKTITTWDDFCELVIGQSRQWVDESLNNFEALGGELMEALQDHGFPITKLRRLRQASAPEREQLRLAAQAGDAEKVDAIFLDIALRHKEERDGAAAALTAQAEEHKKALATKDRYIAKHEAAERERREAQAQLEVELATEADAMRHLLDASLAHQASSLAIVRLVNKLMDSPLVRVQRSARATLQYADQFFRDQCETAGIQLNPDARVDPPAHMEEFLKMSRRDDAGSSKA